MNVIHPVLYLWAGMFLMSILSFSLMGIDKNRARRGAWRISEQTLFTFAILGGAVGGTCGMFHFHHKTRHWYFRYGFPILAILQIALALGFTGLSLSSR